MIAGLAQPGDDTVGGGQRVPGAFLGAVWGQVAGGVTGLAGYSVHRTLKESKKQGDPLALTSGAKKFLGRTLGGVVIGGGVGTAAGALGGRGLGQMVGQALGGPGAASVGGSVGGWLGALGLAYGGAKLGAGIGSGRLLGTSPFQPPSEDGKKPPENPGTKVS